MSDEIVWRSAIKADRALLMNFTCTAPRTKDPRTWWVQNDPRPWERMVQSGIRDLRVPVRPPKFILVGVDSKGIAGAVYYREVDGAQHVHIELVAIANRHRRTEDREVVKQLGEELQSAIIDRATQYDLDRILVTALVHPENRPSRRICEEAGLEPDETTYDDMLVYRLEHFLSFN